MNDLPRLPYYHVDHLIAEGGTARVYWGVDLRSGYPVAIKELKIRHFKNKAIKDNFKDIEAQMYLYMQHPNIPKLVDFIDMPNSQQMFIVMEFIQGRTLEQFIYNEIGLIPEQKALPMFLEILDTMAYIHNKGYLHLDIKTNNVMLKPDGGIKIIDLGIASRMTDASTNTGHGYGTPAYMPTEQSEKRLLGKYTDIFALGVVLFEMLTGRLPFNSDNPNPTQNIAEIRNKIKYEPTPKMKQFYPMIGDGLQAIVEKATAKEPNQRYQTCEEFARGIKNYIKQNNHKR